MTEFKFTIGMSTTTIMGSLNKLPNATDKTKQFIINFCNDDKDGKITDEVELAMLNSWSNGSEKVTMPKEPQSKPYINTHYKTEDGINMHFKEYRSKTSGNLLKFNFNSHFNTFMSVTNKDIRDTLHDYDNDGVANMREVEINSNNSLSIQNFFDDDLDGKFDRYLAHGNDVKGNVYSINEYYDESHICREKSTIIFSKKAGGGYLEIFEESYTDLETGEVTTNKTEIRHAAVKKLENNVKE